MASIIKLLLVDDDDIHLYIFKKIIEQCGYLVDLIAMDNCSAGITYLKDLNKNKGQFPDIIFVDLNMPVLNGWDFLTAYNQLEIKQNVLLYMLTSSIFDNDIADSKSFPILNGYYFKPITTGQLRNLFQEILAARGAS